MSEERFDFYDTENKKPYSVHFWNKLIYWVDQAVEESWWGFPIFEMPPLVHPLKGEDTNHVWTLEDVKELRRTLKAACPPNIRFTEDGDRADGQEEFKFWTREALDEIEDEIDEWTYCNVPQLLEANPSWSWQDAIDYCTAVNGDTPTNLFCWEFAWDASEEEYHAYIDDRIDEGA